MFQLKQVCACGPLMADVFSIALALSTLKAPINCNDKIYILINAYTPNKDEDIICFFNNLLTTMQNENLHEEENIIVGGDFNCPLNTLLDKKDGIMIPRKSVVARIAVFKVN